LRWAWASPGDAPGERLGSWKCWRSGSPS
jgi:hypothetical protein